MQKNNLSLLIITLTFICTISFVGFREKPILTAQDNKPKERILVPQALTEEGNPLTVIDLKSVGNHIVILYKDAKAESYYYVVETDNRLPATASNTGLIVGHLLEKGGLTLLDVAVSSKGDVSAVSYWDGSAWHGAKSGIKINADPEDRPLPPFTQVPEISPGDCWEYAYSEWRCISAGAISGCCLVDIYKYKCLDNVRNTITVSVCCDKTITGPGRPNCQDHGVPLS